MSAAKTTFKPTDMGPLPLDWECVPLGSVAAFRTGPFGAALHKSDYTQGGIPIINPMHIVDGRIRPSITETVLPETRDRLAEFVLREHDIVLGRRGDMGRCAVAGSDAGALCGSGSFIVRPKVGVSAAFLQRVISSEPSVRRLEEASIGSTMHNLN